MNADAQRDSGSAIGPTRVRWYKSVYFRVIILCIVLLLCLLASLVLIVNHFFLGAVRDMEAAGNQIIREIFLKVEESPNIDFDALTDEMRSVYEMYELNIEERGEGRSSTEYALKPTPEGIVREMKFPLVVGDRPALMTLRVNVRPQVEILRALKSKYMLFITTVFILTLVLMVFVISRMLHPLRRLAETCAAISAGNLRSVSTRGASGEIRALENTFNEMVQSLREKELMADKLRQAQRLSALGNLAAGVAHDIRNPLNAIKLLSSHAMDNLEDQDVAAANSLRTIRDEVDRLENIVSGFLSLARERELAPELCKVDALLEECVRLFRKDAEGRGVRLISELNAGETKLLLDPKQWTRAILNVLLNALEACPAEGRVRLFSRVTDRACEIEIRDDGPGVSRDVADRVFEPYFTTKPGGTGLGLSITRGIIEEHGGSINLTSVEGHGCQVLISLPLNPVTP